MHASSDREAGKSTHDDSEHEVEEKEVPEEEEGHEEADRAARLRVRPHHHIWEVGRRNAHEQAPHGVADAREVAVAKVFRIE